MEFKANRVDEANVEIKATISKELIENKIELVEKASEQVFIFLDRILEEKNEQVMKQAANKLFNEEK